MPAIICQAVGCCNPRQSSQFMCKPHWFALPRPLRTAINTGWRDYNKADSERRSQAWLDYIVARDEARRWTAEGEGKLAQFEPDAPRVRALHERRATL